MVRPCIARDFRRSVAQILDGNAHLTKIGEQRFHMVKKDPWPGREYLAQELAGAGHCGG
jgi:hypothetical protein